MRRRDRNMHEREAIIRPWFDMWLCQQDPRH